jgi:glycosyltransferase involved in cell wall biosynthesis
MEETGAIELSRRASQLGLSETILILPAIAPVYLPLIYQSCTALFHPTLPVAWGDPFRYALACGKPAVGITSVNVAAVVGPAAYLVPAGDMRAMGAALVSVVVDEDLAGQLSERAHQRALSWTGDDFIKGLVEIYRRIANSI